LGAAPAATPCTGGDFNHHVGPDPSVPPVIQRFTARARVIHDHDAPLRYRGPAWVVRPGVVACEHDPSYSTTYDHLFLRYAPADPATAASRYRINTVERVCTALSDHPVVFVHYG
jgi:hypothetical protein